MIARKQEISLELNQVIDASLAAPATLLLKERHYIAQRAMRLKRGKSGERIILAEQANRAQKLPQRASRAILRFSRIEPDRVRRVGFNGKPVTVVTFRTTFIDAENRRTPACSARTKCMDRNKPVRQMNRTARYAAPFSCLLQLAIHISLKRHALP